MSVDIASLWRRELTLSLLATDLDLDMTAPPMKADGPGIFPLPQYVEIGPLRVGIGSVRLKGGHAVIREPEAAWTIEVAGADVTARPAAGDLDVSGRLDALRVEALGRREHIERIVVDGRLAADLLRIRQIDWRWEGEAMRLDGEMRRPWLASREVSLRLKGVIGLGALAKAAGLDQRIDGKAQVGADITGPAAAPRIAARVRIPELGVAAVTAQDVTIEGEWGDDKLRVDDIQARLGTGRLRGRLEAGPISTGGRHHVARFARSRCCPDLWRASVPGRRWPKAWSAMAASTWPELEPPGEASARRSTAASPRAPRSPCAGRSTSISRRSAVP